MVTRGYPSTPLATLVFSPPNVIDTSICGQFVTLLPSAEAVIVVGFGMTNKATRRVHPRGLNRRIRLKEFVLRHGDVLTSALLLLVPREVLRRLSISLRLRLVV